MTQVQTPKFIVEYNGKDISADLTPHLVSLTYTDHVKGKSDEVEISLEDADARWRNEWYPQKGDTLNVQIGFVNNLVDCGEFVIDEIELQGPPDTVSIRGMASSINKSLRTRKNKAHENKTLKDIAQATCSALGLTLDDGTKIEKVKRPDISSEKARIQFFINKCIEIVRYDGVRRPIAAALVAERIAVDMNSLKSKGYTTQSNEIQSAITTLVATQYTAQDVGNFAKSLIAIKQGLDSEPKEYTKKSSVGLDKIRLTRSTQNRETDLEYLKRLSETYGYSFSVRGTTMHFYHLEDLEGASSVNKIDRSDLLSYSFKDKASKVYKSAKVSYHDPKTNKVIKGEHTPEPTTTADGSSYSDVTSDDTLEIRDRAENEQQAKAMAKAALHEHNSKTQTGSVTVIGNPLFVAGNNLDITGMGSLSGKFHIEQSTHKIDRSSGYTVDLELKRVGMTVSKSEYKTKSPQTKPKPRTTPSF